MINFAKDEEYHSVVELFKRYSDDLQADRLLLGWKEFCRMQEEYNMALLEGIGPDN